MQSINKHNNVHYIVGDHFVNFINYKKNVVSYSEFKNLLLANGLEANGKKYVFGQGLSVKQKKELTTLARENALTGSLLVDDEKPASFAITHKHNEKNILITKPRKLKQDTYVSSLVIDSPAELSDHITGQHIPGMVIIEAARQLFIAVMEEYYLKDLGKKYYFVLKEINVKYEKYMFPIPTKLFFQVNSFTKSPIGYHSKATVNVFQSFGRLCCSLDLSFGVNEEKIMSKLENNNAFEAIEVLG